MNNPDLVILCHYSFYDHPLNGVTMYKGTSVWFSVKDENHSMLSKYKLESIKQKRKYPKLLKGTCYENKNEVNEGH